jgi:hypothetical protein
MTDASTIKATIELTHDSTRQRWTAYMQHGSWAEVWQSPTYAALIETTKARLDEWVTYELRDITERTAEAAAPHQPLKLRKIERLPPPQQLPLPLED